MALTELIIERLHQVLREQNLSLPELARRASVSPPTMYRIESGEVSPSIETLEKVAKATQKSVPWFCGAEQVEVNRIEKFAKLRLELYAMLAQMDDKDLPLIHQLVSKVVTLRAPQEIKSPDVK